MGVGIDAVKDDGDMGDEFADDIKCAYNPMSIPKSPS